MDSPSLNAKNKPSWIARRIRGIAATFFPELHEQEQGGVRMTSYGLVRPVRTKDGRAQFGEITGGSGRRTLGRCGTPTLAAEASAFSLHLGVGAGHRS